MAAVGRQPTRWITPIKGSHGPPLISWDFLHKALDTSRTPALTLYCRCAQERLPWQASGFRGLSLPVSGDVGDSGRDGRHPRAG